MKPLSDFEAIIALKNAQLEAGHRINTRKSYRGWVVRYRAARKAGICKDLQGFLSYLTNNREARVNAKTVRQALNALKFYHEKCLGISIAENSLVVPAINQHRNMPVWLTHEEAMDLIGRMTGDARLQAEMLYGTGGRITALLTLRLKDLDLQKGMVHFRHDKGGKSRSVRLPRAVMHRLMAHVANVRLQWEDDCRRGVVFPSPEPEDMKKLGRARFGTLPFCWLFPSRDVRTTKQGLERWHTTDHAISEGIKKASQESGIIKRVSPHVLRHSNATSLSARGVPIREIQEHLGHTNVKTTEIYTHVTGLSGVVSPMDCPPVTVEEWRIEFPRSA